MNNKKAILLIMDGWGKGLGDHTDAIAQAKTPFIDQLYKTAPHSELLTHSEYVGLPNGQMGNSEVGHLNIGAGRVIYQDLLKIDLAVKNHTIDTNPALQATIEYVKSTKCRLHLMGLVSNGGVHSSLEHLKGLCTVLLKNGISDISIHAFTDGRDTDPKSGITFIKELLTFIADTPITLDSIIGRYYAMDRDHRWERVKLAYDLLVHGKGTAINNLLTAMEESYEKGITDEFLPPMFKENGLHTLQKGDAALCFNFRTDRCREITTVLTQTAFEDYQMLPLELYFVTLTNYDQSFKNVHVLFNNDNVKMPLGEVLSVNGKKQIRIAETEKYPHVTFFFNGGRETPFEGEKRIMIPSPKVATYDLQPEMSARALTKAILPEIAQQTADFICLNFANTDMVGHTGVFKAVVEAAETVNDCVEEIVNVALANDYGIFLTSDHGNADYMVNEDGSPNTAHTKNPVPLFFISKDKNYDLENGKLADLAPTILNYMEIAVPSEMDGRNLLSRF